ncbi:uncharacterized protein BO88DRAFT_430555 [Aspergillus vadensis CBS 113365]|uniref:Uncharacterized protein n=1 Tax=Aspergillus vadensis (strain CBS 113365 / IMI 142717 / IBT 24658) TaxID=1448311 RepID=A0A319ASP4_ASPVC|nr:hypothetical protein BO88DRAFT_430555 [Aspergillus vadensis CBS 113365]PYH63309.1 hypothetical protein BO88DRAFT_430555 [Aspergillus vadensis CBS 113365]
MYEIRRELIVETMALESWGWLPQAENVGDTPLGIAPASMERAAICPTDLDPTDTLSVAEM